MKHLTSIMTNVTDNGKDATAFFRTERLRKLRDRSHDTAQKIALNFFVFPMSVTTLVSFF